MASLVAVNLPVHPHRLRASCRAAAAPFKKTHEYPNKVEEKRPTSIHIGRNHSRRHALLTRVRCTRNEKDDDKIRRKHSNNREEEELRVEEEVEKERKRAETTTTSQISVAEDDRSKSQVDYEEDTSSGSIGKILMTEREAVRVIEDVLLTRMSRTSAQALASDFIDAGVDSPNKLRKGPS